MDTHLILMLSSGINNPKTSGNCWYDIRQVFSLKQGSGQGDVGSDDDVDGWAGSCCGGGWRREEAQGGNLTIPWVGISNFKTGSE